jgi:hypothetical protein
MTNKRRRTAIVNPYPHSSLFCLPPLFPLPPFPFQQPSSPTPQTRKPPHLQSPTNSHGRMAKGVHGLPKVSSGPAMPCGQAIPETVLQSFQGWPAHRAAIFYPFGHPTPCAMPPVISVLSPFQFPLFAAILELQNGFKEIPRCLPSSAPQPQSDKRGELEWMG